MVIRRWFCLPLLFCGALTPGLPAQDTGLFDGHNDIGTVLHPGSAAFDPTTKTYTLNGSGENMWFASDNFHFLWKKMTGDFSLSATVALTGTEGDNHRKAVLMIRQNLDSDAPYAGAAIHGDGLTSLQFRETKGAPTHEVEADVSGPKRLRIEKRGDRFYLLYGSEGSGELSFAGGSAKVVLTAPFYVGIGVCAHNKDNVQQAVFTDVDLDTKTPGPQTPHSFSTVQTVTVASTDARAAYVSPGHLTSPNWSQDGGFILFSDEGKLEQIPAGGGTAEKASGEAPEEYAQEHSADGRYVYVSSTRSGTAQIWRLAVDGSEAEQLTHDDQNNTNPRLSPDGQQLAFLSYTSRFNLLSPNTDVSLRVLSLPAHSLKTIAKFLGGPGSFSVHPWSPDGKRVTFISYQSFTP